MGVGKGVREACTKCGTVRFVNSSRSRLDNSVRLCRPCLVALTLTCPECTETVSVVGFGQHILREHPHSFAINLEE